MVGNVIWLICGGLLVAIEYFVAGIALCLTIIGIPYGFQAIRLGVLALCPFGSRSILVEEQNGLLSKLVNVIWIIIGGIWIALTHMIWGVLLFVTIIGIPFAREHFKLSSLAISPFGRIIVDKF